MKDPQRELNKNDHCRIGSLEIYRNGRLIRLYDHCRIGSLEIDISGVNDGEIDHCRIGSLESQKVTA